MIPSPRRLPAAFGGVGLLLAALLAWILPAAARDYRGPLDMTADLDGDGDMESIYVLIPESRHGIEVFVLWIGGAMIVSRVESIEPNLHLVDIDSTDSYQEIAIEEAGPSDDYATHLFRYASGSIQKLGIISGTGNEVGIDGSGIIRTRCRGNILQTWFHDCKYRWNEYTGAVERIEETYYSMGTKVRILQDFEVLTGPRGKEVAGVLHAGESAVILGSDDKAWCQIESETGLKGWFAVLGYTWVLPARMFATELFEGLDYAD